MYAEGTLRYMASSIPISYIYKQKKPQNVTLTKQPINKEVAIMNQRRFYPSFETSLRCFRKKKK